MPRNRIFIMTGDRAGLGADGVTDTSTERHFRNADYEEPAK